MESNTTAEGDVLGRDTTTKIEATHGGTVMPWMRGWKKSLPIESSDRETETPMP